MKNKMAASHGSGPQSPPSIGRPVDRVFEEAQFTGEIILNGRKLRDFPKICNKYDLSDTVHVDISRNRLADVPGEVCSYIYVERFNCYHNVIRSIPDAISQLQALTHLNLSRNQLTVLPPALCMLSSLEVLFVSNNKLVSLPEEIGQLENLMDLDVSCNEIAHLPLQIGDLTSLRSLNLRRNFLVELPVEISRLHLYKLDFSSNRIEKIPTVFRKMETLQQLIQANNPLTSPPAYICTKGKQHIMKYLHIEAIKEDRKRGIMVSNDFDLKRVTRKSLPPQSSEELRGIIGGPDKWKRHTVLSSDSGYSTGDGEKNGWHSGELWPHEVNNNGLNLKNTVAMRSSIDSLQQRAPEYHSQPHIFSQSSHQPLPPPPVATMSSPSAQYNYPQHQQQQQQHQGYPQRQSPSPVSSKSNSGNASAFSNHLSVNQHNHNYHREETTNNRNSPRNHSNSSTSSSSTLSPGPGDHSPYSNISSPPSTSSSKPPIPTQPQTQSYFPNSSQYSGRQHHYLPPPPPPPTHQTPDEQAYQSQDYHSPNRTYSPQLLPYPTSINLAESGPQSPTSPTTPTNAQSSTYGNMGMSPNSHSHINSSISARQKQQSSSPSNGHVRQWSNSSNMSENSLPPPPPSLLLPPNASPSPASLSPASLSSGSHQWSNSPSVYGKTDQQHHNPSSSQSWKLQSAPFYGLRQNVNANPPSLPEERNSTAYQYPPPPQSLAKHNTDKVSMSSPPPPHPNPSVPHQAPTFPLVYQSVEGMAYIDEEDTFDKSPPRIMTGSMEDEFTRELKRQKADYERRKKEAEEIRAKQIQQDEEDREKEECRRAAIKLQEEQKKQEELRRQEEMRKQEELRRQEELRVKEEMRKKQEMEEEEARKREEEVRKLQEAVRLREAEEAMQKQRQAEEIQKVAESRLAEEAKKSKLSSNYYNHHVNHPTQPPPPPPPSSTSSSSSLHTYANTRSLPPKPPSSLPVHGVMSQIPVSQQRDSPQQDKEYIMSENEYRNALSSQSFKEQNRRLANSTQYRRTTSDGLKKSTPSPASQVEVLNHINKNGGMLTDNTSSSSRLSSASTTPSVSPSPSPSSSISYLARPSSHNSSPHSSNSHLAKPSTSSSSTSSANTTGTTHHSNLAKPSSTSSSSSQLAKPGAGKSSVPRASPSANGPAGQNQVVRRTKLAGDRSNTSSPVTARSTRTAQGSTGLRPTGGSNSLAPGGSSNIRRSSNSSTTDEERGSNKSSSSTNSTSLGTSRLKSSRLEEPRQRTTTGQTSGVRKLGTPDNDNKRINTKPPTSTYGSNRTRPAASRSNDDGPTMRNKDEYHREEAEQMDRLRQTVETRLKVTLPDNLAEALRDGVVLCHLANQIRPRSVGSIHVPSPAVPKLTPAKCRRNVDNFLEACRKIGVGQEQICIAQDILEERGISRVAITVAALVAIGTNPKQSAV